MRHRKSFAKLNRKASHRKALLRNLATSFALAGHLTTTTAKAKALVSYYERLITLAKRKDDKNAIRELKKCLYTEPAQKAFALQMKELKRTSGYLTTTKVGFRAGDRAEMTQVKFAA